MTAAEGDRGVTVHFLASVKAGSPLWSSWEKVVSLKI